jgi:hypothetical protein
VQFITVRIDTPWMRHPSAPTAVATISPPYQVMPSRAKSRLAKGTPVRRCVSIA